MQFRNAQYSLMFLLLICSNEALSQFSLSAQFKPRSELRHGYRVVATRQSDAAFFVSQRSRLILDYKGKGITTKLSVQDVRVWGDEPQLSNFPNAAVHEAWAQLDINEAVDIRLGRQELIYGDHRLLGNVDWVQQGRSHDAMMIHFQKSGWLSHLGLAYNNESESLFRNQYTLANYRSLALWWLKKTFDNGFDFSFLTIGEGLEDDNSTLHYRWTIGPDIKYSSAKYALNSCFYYQLGESTSNVDLSAFLFSLNNTFKFDRTNLGIGLDFVSGTDALNSNGQKIRSFHTLYATNHKFYGLMDYFLNIPADTKGGGLVDIYAKMSNKIGAKSSFGTHLHYFLLANDVEDPGVPGTAINRGLGWEVDLVFSHSINSDVQFQIGCSAMVPTDAMRVIRGGDDSTTNFWAWTMVAFKPTFFKTKKEEDD